LQNHLFGRLGGDPAETIEAITDSGVMPRSEQIWLSAAVNSVRAILVKSTGIFFFNKKGGSLHLSC